MSCRCFHQAGTAAALCLLLPVYLSWPTFPVRAGDSDYQLRADDVAGDTGEQVELGIHLQNDGEELSGWSLAVCHDAELVTLDEVAVTDVVDTLNDGDAPDLSEITLYDDGFVAGVVICLTACATLAPGDEEELYTVTYTLAGLAPATAPVTFCDDTLPAVDNLVVLDGGDDVTPDSTPGSITIEGPDPLYYHLLADDLDVLYDAVDGEVSFALSVSIAGDKNDPDFPQPVDGMTLALFHDAELLVATGVIAGGDVADLDSGAGAEFFSSDLDTDGEVQVEILVDDDGEITLSAEDPTEVAVISYESEPAALRSNLVGRDSDITWNPDASRVDVSGFFVGLLPDAGSVVRFLPQERLRRGDVNGDGETAFGDALTLLEFLFSDGSIQPCNDAADVNDDDRLNLSDPLRLLRHIFLEEAPPPPPYPDCGFDTTGETHCQTYNEC